MTWVGRRVELRSDPGKGEGVVRDSNGNVVNVQFRDGDYLKLDVRDLKPIDVRAAVGYGGALAAPAAIKATPFRWLEPASIPRREFLYARHYIRQFVSVDMAPGGVGKSSLVMTEALAMVSGKPLLGEHPAGRLKVWYFNGEDPMEELQRRIMAAAIHYDLKPADFEDRLFIDSGRIMPIVLADQDRNGTKIATPVVAGVLNALKAHAIDVLIIDPFVSSHRVSENDNNAIELVAKQWAKIADEAGCAINLVHHVRKTGGQEVTVEDGRGASSLLAAARSARAFNTMTKAEADSAGEANRRPFFSVTNGKSNLAPPSDARTWFKMVGVDLGNAPEPPALPIGDSVGVVTSWKFPDAMEGVTVNDLKAAQRAVAGSGPWKENSQSNDWVGYPIATALGLNGRDPAHKRMIKQRLAVWINTGMFERVERRDPKRREVKTYIEVGTRADD